MQTVRFSDPFDLVGVSLDGRFQIEREVAEGGFGVVYRAVQVALDRPVALKVLKTPPGLDAAANADFQEKFAAEARTIARMRHPNIVGVHDFGISMMPSGTTAAWMALEWLDGTTLDDQLRARRGNGGQSPAEVMALMRPVLRAFAYAHRDGIAHRDIKPANIMVVSAGAEDALAEQVGLLRILDFGIAKVMNGAEDAGTGRTRTAGMPAFSPQYAAPEQVAFGRTGPWTDVHALGLILTELLVDQPAYGATDVQLFEEVMAATRPTPGAKGRDVGPWEAVLGKALALSPGERWKGAGELLSALEGSVDAATTVASGRAPPDFVPVVGSTVLYTEERTRPRPVTFPRPVATTSAQRSVGQSRRGPLLGFALVAVLGSVAWAIVANRSSPSKPLQPPDPPGLSPSVIPDVPSPRRPPSEPAEVPPTEPSAVAPSRVPAVSEAAEANTAPHHKLENRPPPVVVHRPGPGKAHVRKSNRTKSPEPTLSEPTAGTPPRIEIE